MVQNETRQSDNILSPEPVRRSDTLQIQSLDISDVVRPFGTCKFLAMQWRDLDNVPGVCEHISDYVPAITELVGRCRLMALQTQAVLPADPLRLG